MITPEQITAIREYLAAVKKGVQPHSRIDWRATSLSLMAAYVVHVTKLLEDIPTSNNPPPSHP